MRLNEATVLIVDDEPELLEIFSLWLEREGCLVFTAPNGAEALEVLEARKIDALVSDIRMPVMDGMALVRSIYERKHVVPIILVSGHVNAAVGAAVGEMCGLGVEAVVEKPLNRQDLLNLLQNCLAKIELEDSHVLPARGQAADLMQSGLAITFEDGVTAVYSADLLK